MRAVAERLRFRVTAGTPEIVFAWFEFNFDGAIACWFAYHAAVVAGLGSLSSFAGAAFRPFDECCLQGLRVERFGEKIIDAGCETFVAVLGR